MNSSSGRARLDWRTISPEVGRFNLQPSQKLGRVESRFWSVGKNSNRIISLRHGSPIRCHTPLSDVIVLGMRCKRELSRLSHELRDERLQLGEQGGLALGDLVADRGGGGEHADHDGAGLAGAEALVTALQV